MSSVLETFAIVNEIEPLEASLKGLFLNATSTDPARNAGANAAGWQECAAGILKSAPAGLDLHVSFYPLIDQLTDVRKKDIEGRITWMIAARGHRQAAPLAWIITDNSNPTLVIRLPYLAPEVDRDREIIKGAVTEIIDFLKEEFGHARNREFRQTQTLAFTAADL